MLDILKSSKYIELCSHETACPCLVLDIGLCSQLLHRGVGVIFKENLGAKHAENTNKEHGAKGHLLSGLNLYFFKTEMVVVASAIASRSS